MCCIRVSRSRLTTASPTDAKSTGCVIDSAQAECCASILTLLECKSEQRRPHEFGNKSAHANRSDTKHAFTMAVNAQNDERRGAADTTKKPWDQSVWGCINTQSCVKNGAHGRRSKHTKRGMKRKMGTKPPTGRTHTTISCTACDSKCSPSSILMGAGQYRVPASTVKTDNDHSRAKSTDSKTSTKTRSSRPNYHGGQRKQKLNIPNASLYSCKYSHISIPARRRAKSASEVPKRTSTRTKWTRMHENVETYSMQSEQNGSSQSEKRHKASEIIIIGRGGCAWAKNVGSRRFW